MVFRYLFASMLVLIGIKRLKPMQALATALQSKRSIMALQVIC